MIIVIIIIVVVVVIFDASNIAACVSVYNYLPALIFNPTSEFQPYNSPASQAQLTLQAPRLTA